MSNIIKLTQREIKAREVIEAEARDWLVRMDAGSLPSNELGELDEWLNRSPYHREACRRVAAVWNGLDQLNSVMDGRTPAGSAASARTNRGTMLGLAAAGIVCIAVLVFLLAVYLNVPEPGEDTNFTGEYATAIGETRSLTLPDTSGVRLNTDSKIEVYYNGKARMIKLVKGEAWFDVRHNPDQPFIVYAGRLAVRAVGTAFSVYVKQGKIDLTVTDGRIEVATFKDAVPSHSLAGPEFLNSAVYRVPVVEGQHMVLDESIEAVNEKIELVREMEPAQLEKRLSWRDGILMFDNDTLEQVVAEINRYSPVKIEIRDPEIRRLRFGGYFQASDVTTILATLEQNYGISLEQLDSGTINLSRENDLP